ncbi:MAG: hypothetical protein J0L53_04840 [Spirochaetes bacterium]|nr:hypothetical protein [Spirochaetota bacterium]
MRFFPLHALLFAVVVQGCAIDTPIYNSDGGYLCRSVFDLDKTNFSYFNYAGSLNGTAVSAVAVVTASVPLNAPATRQIIVNTEKFSLTLNLAAATYGIKTIATGNPEIWMSALTCGGYLVCGSEKYIAGYYNAALRGSGTVSLTRPTVGAAQIVINATLPDENTSVSQTMQFQHVTFSEVCY